MPNIRGFDAPVTKLTPSQEGFAAWETAGRRLGPLYDNIAQSDRELGRLFADTVRLFYKPDATKTRSGGLGGGGIRSPSGTDRPAREISTGAPNVAAMARGLTTGSTGEYQAAEPRAYSFGASNPTGFETQYSYGTTTADDLGLRPTPGKTDMKGNPATYLLGKVDSLGNPTGQLYPQDPLTALAAKVGAQPTFGTRAGDIVRPTSGGDMSVDESAIPAVGYGGGEDPWYQRFLPSFPWGDTSNDSPDYSNEPVSLPWNSGVTVDIPPG